MNARDRKTLVQLFDYYGIGAICQELSDVLQDDVRQRLADPDWRAVCSRDASILATAADEVRQPLKQLSQTFHGIACASSDLPFVRDHYRGLHVDIRQPRHCPVCAFGNETHNFRTCGDCIAMKENAS